MHIPDGIISGEVITAGFVVSSALLALSLKKAKENFGDELVPVMGMLAAFIFAGQMLNFPIGGGVSGHFTGAALAAIILGPYRGFLVMTLVLIVQCFGFADGGVTVLGVNTFNMAAVGCFSGYLIFRLVFKAMERHDKSAVIAGAAAAWISVVTAAVMVGIELWLSGKASLQTVIPMLALPYAIIGLVESLVTSAAIAMLMKHRHDLIRGFSISHHPSS